MDWKAFKKYVLDIIYPNRCPFCNSFIKWDKFACDNCIENMPYVPENICTSCGKYPCECDKREYLYDECYTACFYESIAREGIISLKVRQGINAAYFFGNILSGKMKNIDDIDFIVPVPMAKEKIRLRSYNQAEEIAEVISENLKIPVRNDVIYKNFSDIEQHTLNAEERSENAVNMFYTNKSIDIAGKNVIICDDVLTTGSTINSCTKLLKEMGANRVICAVCCTTP